MPVNDAAVPRPSTRVSATSPPAGAAPAGTPSAARPRRRRRIATAALSATAALLLSACGDSQPGTAAVVGDQRVTPHDLQSHVDE